MDYCYFVYKICNLIEYRLKPLYILFRIGIGDIMKKVLNRKDIRINRMKKESVEDPHELLLSLVDLGSLDADEALLACVKEMSDAECKRVLGSLSLPECCDEVEDTDDDMTAIMPVDDVVEDSDEDLDDLPDENVEGDLEDSEEDTVDECNRRELEARLRRLERRVRSKSIKRCRK